VQRARNLLRALLARPQPGSAPISNWIECTTVRTDQRIGERSRPLGGIVFDSWARGRIARNLGGEPAMSVVPNLAITGTLTILASLAVLVCAVTFVDGRSGAGV
jgi:hypothetical protein